MPGMDGTGPAGLGSQTGRGLGICRISGTRKAGYGRGLGCGLGYGRGYGRGYGMGFARRAAASDREALLNEKEFLLERAAEIDRRLGKQSEAE